MSEHNVVTEASPKELVPLPVNGIIAVQVGTLLWGLGLVISLFTDKWLISHGVHHTPAICIAGVGLGLLGQVYTKRRVKRLTNH